MKARIILILVIALIVMGGARETFTSQHGELEELEELVTRAVEDDDWLQAQSQEELHEYFQQLFTQELAHELTQETWPFFAEPTGFLEKAQVTKIKTKVIGSNAQCTAQLELYYTGKEHPQLEARGTGNFSLVYLDKQWRIEKMEFSWDYLESP